MLQKAFYNGDELSYTQNTHFKLGNIKRCAFPIRKHGWIMSLIHMVLILLTTGRTIKKVSKVETEKILKQSRKDILRRLQNEISIKIQYIIVSNKMNET